MSFVSDENLVQAVEEIKDHCDEDYAAIDHTHSNASASTSGTGGAAGFISATDQEKLNGISTGAEVNQNAFANVTVGNDTIAADAKQDTLTLTAGSNVTITADTTNDAVTIAATDTTYSNATPSTSGTGGSAGLMSAVDKEKLDGIAAGAQVNSVTGVKGTKESTYRTGNVNLQSSDIGAVSTNGGDMTGDLRLSNGTSGQSIVPWYSPSVGDSFTLPSLPLYDGISMVSSETCLDSNDATFSVNHVFYYGEEETYSGLAYDGDLTFTVLSLPTGAASIKEILFGYSSYYHNVNASGEVIAHDTTGVEHRLSEKADNAVMTGATSSANGAAGLVPAPLSADYDTKFLKADGTWAVPAGGGSSNLPLGTCSTSSASLEKVVVLPGFELYAGARISVKFDYADSDQSTYRSLNVNSTGAKRIFSHGADLSSTNQIGWSAGAICDFIYDGTQWHYLGNNVSAAIIPYVVINQSWTSANLSACKSAVAAFRPCVARFSNGAVVEFDGDPQTDAYN